MSFFLIKQSVYSFIINVDLNFLVYIKALNPRKVKLRRAGKTYMRRSGTLNEKQKKVCTYEKKKKPY